MRKALSLVLILALSLLPIPPAYANDCGGTLISVDEEQITVSSTAVGFSAAKISTSTYKVVYAYVGVSSTAIRFYDTGEAPTTDAGIVVAASTYIGVCGVTNVSQFKAIRDTGSDSVLDVIYYRAE